MAWSDILGQDTPIRLLQAHLASGTVANAYLLAGPEGAGKRRIALEMAKALNCTAEGAHPCDQCSTCTRIDRATHPDVHLLSPSGASEQIKIDDVRALLGRLSLRPYSAAFQVAVIDGADRLTEEAANSLLKGLEEPSDRARFLLTTSRLSFCLPTIVSRCQIVRCPVMARDAAAPSDAWTSQSSWLEEPLPESRDETAKLLDRLIGRLRETALAQGIAGLDVDRCVDTAFELMALRESLEQFVSPKLVAALAREKWLSLEVKSQK
jgi:DNA polymerase III delta' subunit